MVVEIQRINENVSTAPLASETSEGDEIARKILQDVSSLVDDNGELENNASTSAEATASCSEISRTENRENGGAVKKSTTFVYALPGEVLKTALNRHQRGIMDSRIYQLLTKKEIILPQVRRNRLTEDKPDLTGCLPIQNRFSKTNNTVKSHRFIYSIVLHGR